MSDENTTPGSEPQAEVDHAWLLRAFEAYVHELSVEEHVAWRKESGVTLSENTLATRDNAQLIASRVVSKMRTLMDGYALDEPTVEDHILHWQAYVGFGGAGHSEFPILLWKYPTIEGLRRYLNAIVHYCAKRVGVSEVSSGIIGEEYGRLAVTVDEVLASCPLCREAIHLVDIRIPDDDIGGLVFLFDVRLFLTSRTGVSVEVRFCP